LIYLVCKGRVFKAVYCSR